MSPRPHSRRTLIYGCIIAVLVGLYALKFVNIRLPATLPVRATVEARQREVQLLQATLDNRRKLIADQQRQLADARTLAQFYYPATTTGTNIQTQVEKLAYATGLNYSSLRSVSVATTDKDELLRAEEVNITGTVNIKNLIQFMVAVDNHRPVLSWSVINLAPRSHAKEPNMVFLSGRIRAQVLSPEAAALLQTGSQP
jgi:hypothetical protein